jgi:copper-containing nitrite reductase
MATRIHTKSSFITLLLSLVLFLFTITDVRPLTAQSAGHAGAHDKPAAKMADIVRDPADVPPPLADRAAAVLHVTLTAEEVIGQLDPSVGTSYRYWTFDGKVPGPMIRVRKGDTIEVTLRNDASSHMVHSVDFHAALGPGGGAAFSQAVPGQSKTFTFQATTPGLFVYHCGTPMIAEHMANGMYGLILVEPEGGLPHVDHEYYIMQGEIYTTTPKGKTGLQQFSAAKLMREDPESFVFNGAVDALTKEHPLHAEVGETIRVFFGDAGPNATSSLHVVGEIFTRDYTLGSLMSPPLIGVQTASVPPGGAAILELATSVPGEFTMMDHAMARMAKGLMATLEVTGRENAESMHSGPAAGLEQSTNWSNGMGQADTAARMGGGDIDPEVGGNPPSPPINGREKEAIPNPMHAMPRHETAVKAGGARRSGLVPPGSTSKTGRSGPSELNGCMTLLSDGRVMLKDVQSTKTYRLEAQPLSFSENANRLVHVTGGLGSVVAVEDPNIPSFVVDTVDELAPTCSARLTPALLRRARAKATGTGPIAPLTVGMSDMAFMPAKIVVKVGQKVTWKNSSEVIHNVVDDASKAINKSDVHVPDGGQPFDSGLMQPGQAFTRVFTVPGAYRYVCSLHEANGMKGVVVVK